MPCLSRRSFLATAASLAPCLIGCTGEATAPGGPAPNGVEIFPDSIRIQLGEIPSLTKPGGSLVIPEAHVIVIRAADADYRAFTNVCTHAGCGIYGFTHPRMQCQCHGSEFDLQGAVVTGPALLPLARYGVRMASSGTLEISRT